MTSICAGAADSSFGPAVLGECRGGFDFTLLFEQSITTILPAGLFLLALPTRFIYLSRANVKTNYNRLRSTKLGAAVAFVALQLALLVLYSTNTASNTRASIPTAILNLIVALQFLCLSWIEDARSVKPSSLLCVYLIFTTLFDVAQARTIWLRQSSTAVAGLFTASIATKVVLFLLEAKGKRKHLKQEYRSLPPESTSGIVQESFIWWLYPLFGRGYTESIASGDLSDLSQDLVTANSSASLQHAWDTRTTPERRYEFAWAILRATSWSNLEVIPPALCTIAFTFSQPFLISSVLSLVTEPEGELSTQKGYGLIGATALIYLGMAIATNFFTRRINMLSTGARGATVSLIYRRALDIQQGLYDEAAAVTLMSTDTDQVVTCFSNLHSLWTKTIQVALGLFLLARQLGWVCVIPLAAVFVSSVFATIVAKRTHGHQKEWVGAIQKRIATTASVIGEMRSIKMMGLSGLMETTIQNLRIREIHFMKGLRWDIAWRNIICNAPFCISAPLTLAAYAIQASVRNQPSFNTTQVFTSLSIISLLTIPAATLLALIPTIGQSTGCFDRIQKFLVAQPRKDDRQFSGSRNSSSRIGLSVVSNGKDIEMTTLDGKDHNGIAVSATCLEVRPTPSADVVLRDVSFAIPRGSLTMIIGGLASGKSTLLKAILGEIACDKGSVTVADARIAYCDETAWLPNATIRKAICGHVSRGEEDEEWYHACLQACALNHDLDILPEGDGTKIGSGSTTLSGGQRHRVALARALYARAQIVVLDDILGALDVNTKKHVAEQVFGPNGIFKKFGSTVLLVTHSTEYLSYADKILVLSRGTIEYDGSYNEVAGHVVVDNVLSNQKPGDKTQAEPQDAKKKPGQTIQPGDREDLTRRTGDFSVYSYYFRFIGWPIALLFLGFVAIEIASQTFSQLWVKQWADAGGRDLAKYLAVYLVLPFLTLFGIGGFIWCFLIKIAPTTALKLHQVLLKTVMRAPQSFFSETDTGVILNRFSQDMTLVEGNLAIGVALASSTLLKVIVAVGLIATGSVYMGITVPFVIGAVYVLQHVYLRTSRQIRLLDLEARSPLYTHFLETLNGLCTIRAFGWRDDSCDENNRLLDFSQRPYYMLLCIQRWLNLMLDLIVAAEAVIVVGLAVGLRHSTSPGLLGISMNNILSFGSLLASLVSYWTMFETSLGSIVRIKNFERDVAPEDKPGEDAHVLKAWPEHGAIEFHHVTASHNPAAVALHDICLKINPGQKVGICGRTGSGKSSLVATLLRLLELENGTITIDGVDLATVPRDVIRSRLVTLPQDPLIFPGSARYNIDPHGAVADEAIISALDQCGLWSALQERGGLDAEVTGSALSKGQRQLLALARAVLRAREEQLKVLILDEPTSSVDAETDAVVQQVVGREFASCTVLTVAHRMDSILRCDVAVVLEEGRLVEFGTPEELLTLEGRFAKLVRG